MLDGPKVLEHYRTLAGRCPFVEWVLSLDHQSRVFVLYRLERLTALGHLGDFNSVGDGVLELKINKGPGLRVYLIPELNDRIVVLNGGIKRGQTRDIQKAKEYARDRRLRGG